MGILHEDVVVLRPPEKEGDPTVITVNCPDQLGLGCDICHILLFFGVTITRADLTTDGKWCYIVLWVMGKPTTRWGLVKKRLVGACPSYSPTAWISSYYKEELQPPKPPDVFLLKFCCHDQRGLLHDITEILCKLELNIKKVKVSTTPDGKVLDLFFITDTRDLLHTKKRQEDVKDHLRSVMENAMICDIEKVGTEVTACSQTSSFLPRAITNEGTTNFEIPDKQQSRSSRCVSVTMDNSLSPSHTLVQIVCHDYKGLLYDLMRTLKDYNIQVSYGRGTTKPNKMCDIDLFIMQSDGKKIVDSSKQEALRSRLCKELVNPLRVVVVSRGPETELLVANPVELSGKGRPLVLHDITLALKMLNICIFLAEIGRYIIEHREHEVYQFLLHEGDCSSISRNKIEKRVQKILMGWDFE